MDQSEALPFGFSRSLSSSLWARLTQWAFREVVALAIILNALLAVDEPYDGIFRPLKSIRRPFRRLEARIRILVGTALLDAVEELLLQIFVAIASFRSVLSQPLLAAFPYWQLKFLLCDLPSRLILLATVLCLHIPRDRSTQARSQQHAARISHLRTSSPDWPSPFKMKGNTDPEFPVVCTCTDIVKGGLKLIRHIVGSGVLTVC